MRHRFVWKKAVRQTAPGLTGAFLTPGTALTPQLPAKMPGHFWRLT